MDSVNFSIVQALRTNQGLTQVREGLYQKKSAELKAVLDRTMEEIACFPDALTLIGRLVEILPLGQLPEELTVEASQTAKKLEGQATAFLRSMGRGGSISLEVQLMAWRDKLVILMENLLESLGVNDFFRISLSKYDSLMKGQRIMVFSTYYTLCTAFFGLLVSERTSKKIAASVLMSMSLLSLIYPHIQPIPSALPFKGQNVRKLFAEKKVSPAPGDPLLREQIAANLISSAIHKNHTAILGVTGSGKTNLALAVSEEILNGKYPELLGREIFIFNTAQLLHEKNPIEDIMKALGRHLSKAIIILDELHALYPLEGGKATISTCAEKLKTKLGSDTGSFPAVVGITTNEEFLRIQAIDPAFTRRFSKKVEVKLTEDVQIYTILRDKILKEAPYLIMEEGAIESLVTKTRNVFDVRLGEGKVVYSTQPEKFLTVLSACLAATGSLQRSKLEGEIDRLCTKIAQGQLQLALTLFTELSGGVAEKLKGEIQEWDKERATKEGEFLTQQALRSQFFEVRNSFVKAKEAMYETALKVSKLASDSLPSKEIVLFSLQVKLVVEMEKWIKKQAHALDIKTELNKDLIDSFVKKTKESEENTAEALSTAAILRERRQPESISRGTSNSPPPGFPDFYYYQHGDRNQPRVTDARQRQPSPLSRTVSSNSDEVLGSI